jgi:serine protease Do
MTRTTIVPAHRLTILAAGSAMALLTTCLATRADAQDQGPGRLNPLREASGSIETLVARVSRSVVQITVTGYQPTGDPSRTDVALGRSHSLGSGVVIDTDGHILTNAHVVAGAERIEVTLPDRESAAGPPRLGAMDRQVVQARLVGIAPDLDLALVAVDVSGLQPLPLADYSRVRQGELVFAFGSPDGLRNSVTMGMVSAVARQTENFTPLVYVQTDAAINPGNSGGPLVNVNGELVGINTFIRSASGGSEGLGFALPSAFVALAYPQLRDFGHLHRAVIGLALQTVTPLLGAGLSLPPDARLIVADVGPGSPAARAGFGAGDLITAIDGRRVDDLTLAELYLTLYSLHGGQRLTLTATRGDRTFTAPLDAVDLPHVCERATVIDSQGTLVEPLGILGVSVGERLAPSMPGLRDLSGVLVAARVNAERTPAGVLESGDVIHAINGVAVTSPATLRAELARIDRHGAIVLQVERGGQLTYVAFERDSD